MSEAQPKACVNCRHFRIIKHEYRCAREENRAYFHPVTGRLSYVNGEKYEECAVNRRYDNLCGDDGKWFEPPKTFIEKLRCFFNH